MGCCLWGRTESDTTEATQQQQQQQQQQTFTPILLPLNTFLILWILIGSPIIHFDEDTIYLELRASLVAQW